MAAFDICVPSLLRLSSSLLLGAQGLSSQVPAPSTILSFNLLLLSSGCGRGHPGDTFLLKGQFLVCIKSLKLIYTLDHSNRLGTVSINIKMYLRPELKRPGH